MPRGELIRSKQKKRSRRRPILDLRHAPVVCGICAENHVESGKVVDDNGYKLENVD
jgi:hypothetical protein